MIPANSSATTTLYVSLNPTSVWNAGDTIWFDNVAIVAGNYTGPYFDGSTPPRNSDHRYAWTGTPDASTSIAEHRTIVPVPPTYVPDYPDPEASWQEAVDDLIRYLHGVAAISGPLIMDTMESGDFWAYEVEVTFQAERPWVYGRTKPLVLPPVTPVVVQDIPFNLVKYPSAELADAAAVVVATNYSTNPSVETNNTGWAVAGDGTVILNAQVVGSRSTELAANGTASERAVWTAAGASAVPGWFVAQQEVTLPHAVLAGERYSINMWSASNIQAGAPVLGEHNIVALWRAAGATVRTDTIATITGGSGVATQRGIAPPVGATSVIVRAAQNVTSWPAGSIVRLYADALAVTVP